MATAASAKAHDPLAGRTPRNQLFIDGEFVDAVEERTIDVLSPHDNALITRIAEAGTADVDRAVAAAKQAFPAWSNTASSERGRLLLRLADRIEECAEELAYLETIDTGHPIRDSKFIDVPRTAACFRYFGGMADVGSSRVDLQACKLEYSIVSPK